VLLPELHKLNPEKTKEMITNSSLVANALKDVNEDDDFAVKLKCTVLLAEIWSLFPTLVSQGEAGSAVSQKSKSPSEVGSKLKGYENQTLLQSFGEVIRNGVMEKDNVFKINSIAVSFVLLDRLAQKKSSGAADVYKTLIYALIDNYRSKKCDKTVTKLLLGNFLIIFTNNPLVPLTPLLEPYLAALMEAVSTKNPLSSDEVEFLIKIA